MPYTDYPPPIVMPDTYEGRQEAAWKFPQVRVGFCGEYRKDYYDSRRCEHRQMLGDRHHNWCLRCLCGFPVLNLDEKDQESERLGGTIRV